MKYNTIQRAFKLTPKEYYQKHLQMLNMLIPASLSDKEIEVLATFMSLDKSLIEEEMINTITRRKVMKKLNLSPGGLGNHLKSMIKQKALVKNDVTGTIRINPHLMPDEPLQGYQIKMLKIDGDS
jgi:DNA-binding MarR family transcriptional regulator